jgi:NADH-quinone oxidoreductase subunit L
LILMGLIVGLTLVMIFIAYSLYVRSKRVPTPEGVALNGAHKLVYNKYYVDELYQNIIVKPLYFLSKAFDSVVERLFIDNIVNGTGRAITWSSKNLRLIQTGNTGFYILAMVVSIIVLLVSRSLFF